MRLLLLIILFWPCFAMAQGVPPIPQAMDTGAGSVPMQLNLLEQAYNNMLAGNYAAAEAQYHAFSLQEPDNLDAWEGILWAQNAQGKYKSALKLSYQLAGQQRLQGAMYNYPAHAMLESKRPSEARYYYQLGYRLDPQNHLGNQISREGMAYSYLAMGDYPHYYEQLNRSAALSGIPAPKPKLAFQTTLSYNAPAKNKKAYGMGQSIAYRSWKLSGAYEDFQISKKPFRHVLKTELTKQFKPFDVAVNGRLIDGKDERVYPGQQVGLALSPKFYPGILALKPQVFASYSHYPRFDVQQISAIPQLRWRDMLLEAALHYSYQDNESVGADSTKTSVQLKLNKQLPFGLNLGLHYGSGNDSWLIDSSGALIDTFNQGTANYGVSLFYPFLKRFSLYGYTQINKADQLWYVSLAGRY